MVNLCIYIDTELGARINPVCMVPSRIYNNCRNGIKRIGFTSRSSTRVQNRQVVTRYEEQESQCRETCETNTLHRQCPYRSSIHVISVRSLKPFSHPLLLLLRLTEYTDVLKSRPFSTPRRDTNSAIPSDSSYLALPSGSSMDEERWTTLLCRRTSRKVSPAYH